jgi:hypothetical protein
MVVGALWHRLQRSRSRSTHEPRHETELRQALDSLLDEMVRLEKGHRAGTVGPKAYQRVRSGLIEAIARIEGMLRSSAEVSDTREAQ